MEKNTEQSRDLISIIDDFKSIEEVHRAKKRGLQTVASMEMIEFLRGAMKKIENTSSLRTIIESKLVSLISDSEEELTPAALLRFYELLLKHENDATAPILKILEASVKAQEQLEYNALVNGNGNNGTTPNNFSGSDSSSTDNQGNNLTAKDIEQVKKMLTIFEGLESIEETEN